MTTRRPLNSVREDCAKILSMWKENPSFQLIDVSYDEFMTLVADMDTCTTKISDSEANMIANRLERNRLSVKANDICTRARSMARGFYGPDTTQLKQTGHTIRSERKSPSRKAQAVASASSANAAA